MHNMINRVMAATKKYTVVDYGFFKFLMISFGILLGVYFTQTILHIIWLVWLVFIVSTLWMTYKIINYTK
ncbi:MAG: hypothetical protein PHG75_04270 [Syntrophomonas sp.]|nr:hypothetical protein [Syntrophomonas sp.]